MPPHDLLVEDRGHVRCLTINRPERANSITRDLAKRLIDAVADAESATEVRALMITAAGVSTFCAGADLKELSDEATLGQPYTPILPDLYAALVAMDKPTLAALNGTAAGGGMELALACDLRVAAAGARVGLPEIKQGLCPTFGTVALSRLMPRAVAVELLLTGDLVDVEEVARWGLVRVVPPGQLEAAVWDLANRIAAAAPLVVRKIKALIREGTHLPLLDAMKLQVDPDIYASEDRLEGLRAWREKRPPVWRAR
jgi:enoyl-CoA hydratase/carnithine racemase